MAILQMHDNVTSPALLLMGASLCPLLMHKPPAPIAFTNTTSHSMCTYEQHTQVPGSSSRGSGRAGALQCVPLRPSGALRRTHTSGPSGSDLADGLPKPNLNSLFCPHSVLYHFLSGGAQ
jgi:hypothetical protein